MATRRCNWLIGCVAVAMAACGGCGDGSNGGNVGFGGAQDIGQFRSLVEAGQVPGEQTLDANGFFSEHFVQLPEADCDQVLCGHGMLAVGRDWMTGAYQAALQIGVNTTLDPADQVRMPLNLVVVVDTSGSMASDQRLAYVQRGLHLLIDGLEAGDRLALVTYSTNVSVAAELEADIAREQLHAAVDDLFPSGSTNLHGGLQRGLSMAADAFDSQRQNRVILLSDGLATAGVTDDSSIIAMAESYISDGIGLTTIGVGSEFNVGLMRGLAERGAGNFYFLEDLDAVDEVFTEELEYFVTPIALGLEIEVAPGSDYTLGEVVGTRLWEQTSDGGYVYVPAVFLSSRSGSAGEGRRGGGSTLFIQVLPRPGAPSATQVARFSIRYRVPASGATEEQVVEVFNPTDPASVPEQPYYSHQAMTKNYAVYNLFLGIRQATRDAAYDYHCALDTLVTLESQTRGWNNVHDDADVAGDLVLIAQFANNLRTFGAQQGQCGNWAGPTSDDIELRACSVSGNSRSALFSGLPVLLGILLCVRRRRTASCSAAC